ncbi:MAG: hypothetical protein A2W31_13900 [Planctomycetes bacterium RBG_16_64_10]|nr:MAG: hypothetical protein A2W31_13900 [Planctomycetes bacterium RBG_16_64_10]
MSAGPRPELAPQLGALLQQLRRRIRLYACAEGATAGLIVLGAAFWGTLAVDWVFEPPWPVRVAILVTVAVLLAWVLIHLTVRRLAARLSDTSMAVLLERQFDQFADSLLTVVDHAGDGDRLTGLQRDMLDRTSRAALDAAQEVRLANVLNRAPLLHKGIAAVALLGSITLFGMLAQDTLAFWGQRMMLSTEQWPRRTRLLVAGFPPNARGQRVKKVARGADLRILVQADATLEYPPPEQVEVRCRTADGNRRRDSMTRVGDATAEHAAFQSYHYTFRNVTQPVTFDVAGGDASVPNLQLHVVERPQIVELALRCQYPSYLGREPRWFQVTGAMQIPSGTQLTVRAAANKDLQRMQIDDPELGTETLMKPVGAGPPRRFETVLPPLSADKLLRLSLLDQDGITGREPYRIVLRVVPDEAPQVVVQLRGIGTAITPTAQIPAAGTVTDDHQLDKAWFEYRIAQREAQARPFATKLDGQNELAVRQTLDTRDFAAPNQLAPGDQLQLAIKASDRCDLGAGPNVGSSQYVNLEVVTPADLRTRLDRRELQLRQRFENLIAEMNGTRDLMASIAAQPPQPATDTVPAVDAERLPGTAQPAVDPVAGSAPRRAVGDPLEAAPGQHRVQIARVTQNIQRTGYETLQAAEAFDEIGAELINNRIATESHLERLRQGIAEPLTHVARQMLPAVLDRLNTLPRDAASFGQGSSALNEAIVQADAVLVEMRRILARMIELESYNELLDLLRGIIQDQGQLIEETTQQRKAQLRDLRAE